MSFGLSRGKTLDVGDVGIDMRELPSSDEGRKFSGFQMICLLL